MMVLPSLKRTAVGGTAADLKVSRSVSSAMPQRKATPPFVSGACKKLALEIRQRCSAEFDGLVIVEEGERDSRVRREDGVEKSGRARVFGGERRGVNRQNICSSI